VVLTTKYRRTFFCVDGGCDMLALWKHFVRFGSKADIATQLPIGLVSVNLDNCLPRRASRALIVSGQCRAELSVFRCLQKVA